MSYDFKTESCVKNNQHNDINVTLSDILTNLPEVCAMCPVIKSKHTDINAK